MSVLYPRPSRALALNQAMVSASSLSVVCCFTIRQKIPRLRWTWDQAKNRVNLRVHGLSFEAADFVFDDSMSATREDPYPYEPTLANYWYGRRSGRDGSPRLARRRRGGRRGYRAHPLRVRRRGVKGRPVEKDTTELLSDVQAQVRELDPQQLRRHPALALHQVVQQRPQPRS